MWKPLFSELEKYLRNDDIFAFLPVYYAGGTTSFTPTSEEIYLNFTKDGRKNYLYFHARADAISYIRSELNKNDLSVICGARDNSLSLFAEKIT
jgi:UDP-N-acetylmuramate--alanine ligase